MINKFNEDESTFKTEVILSPKETTRIQLNKEVSYSILRKVPSIDHTCVSSYLREFPDYQCLQFCSTPTALVKPKKQRYQQHYYTQLMALFETSHFQPSIMVSEQDQQVSSPMLLEIIQKNMSYKMIRNISLPRHIYLPTQTIYKTMVRFCFFLRGDYRSLKLANLEDRDKDNYDCVLNSTTTNRIDISIQQQSENSQQILQENGEKIVLDLFKLLEEQKERELSSEDDRKVKNQSLFNLSKYIMYLILACLGKEEMEEMGIEKSLQEKISRIIQRIKAKGQRSFNSETYYFNHSHYDCLFLLLNEQSLRHISLSQDLQQLHTFVYEVQNFTDPLILVQVNILKTAISKIIVKQFKAIISAVNKQINAHPGKYRNYSNYIITKLQYFERVFKGIQTLKTGAFVNRF